MTQDFDLADAAPCLALNEIIWKSVKGPGSKMPAPRFSGLPGLDKKPAGRAWGDDDGDD